MARNRGKISKIGRRRSRGRIFEHHEAAGAKAPKSQLIKVEDILAFMCGDKLGQYPFRAIMDGIGLSHRYRSELQNFLNYLCQHQTLICEGKHFQLARPETFLEGVVSVHPRGFGFATPQAPAPELDLEGDLFIPPPDLGSARHGDRVLLMITGFSQGRPEAKVLAVLSRGVSRIVGIFRAGGKNGQVVPEDDNFGFTLMISEPFTTKVREGEAVLVEISEQKTDRRFPEGRILEVLGDPDDLKVQNEIVIHKFNLPHEFSPEVEAQVREISPAIEPGPNRVDLRDILHITIDGDDARDFDDAVAVVKTKKGYRLYVSIADVSHYVVKDSPLDREAYSRGTSVYFPGRVVPMLPERLSNDLCSLVPNQERYAFTAILDFDRLGQPLQKKFTKSIICSRYRMTYTLVRRILVDLDKEVRQHYKTLLTPLKHMEELAAQLTRQRQARGSIGFDIPEPQVIFSPDGSIENIVRAERNLSHRLIEEFMLAANEAVAQALDEMGRETLYRIHESPDPVKVNNFIDFSRTIGLPLTPATSSPKWFARVLSLVKDTPKEYIIANVLLRTMKRACYSPDNCGHFGLAASYYTHFTSPIRRYPDLIVHRILAAALAAGSKGKAVPAVSVSLAEAGQFLSARERVSVEAEREMADRLTVRFMADKVGQEYSGIISGVTAFGLFIELLECFVSGAVPVKDMRDDYYNFDEKHHRLAGQNTKKIFQVGDLVKVRVSSVEVSRRRVNFSEVEKMM